MPDLRRGESKDGFISRCMSSREAKSDFPDTDQRLAFCFSRFEQGKKKQRRRRRRRRVLKTGG